MGMLKRISRVFKAKVNNALDRAEDPEKLLSQVIMDMNQQLIESKKSVASAIADEKKLERQMRSNQASAREWEEKARLAVKAGKDDLAKEALVRMQEYNENYKQYREQWEIQHNSVEKLKTVLKQLQRKIDEAQRKKNLLIARAKRAKAQKRIQETISNLDDTSAFEAFDKLSEKVDRLEAENEAVLELSSSNNDSDDLESRFAALESGINTPELLLEDLKNRMKEEGEADG